MGDAALDSGPGGPNCDEVLKYHAYLSTSGEVIKFNAYILLVRKYRFVLRDDMDVHSLGVLDVFGPPWRRR